MILPVGRSDGSTQLRTVRIKSVTSNAHRSAIVERRYIAQEQACSQAIQLLMKKAVAMTSSNGDDAKKGSLKHEVRAKSILPRG